MANERKIVCTRPECLMARKHQMAHQFLPSRDPIVKNYPYCKTCLNEITDLNDLQTVFQVLKTIDTPFIYNVWQQVVENNKSDYLFKYVAKLNTFKKYADYRYKDSIFVPDTIEEVSEKQDELREQFKDIAVWNDEWQGEYTGAEIEYLNKYLKDLEADFKIETATQKDYARKIAKTSLETDKAMAKMLKGDPEAEKKYNNLVATFDKLNKTAKFAESERSRTDVALGNFGKVFEAVEEHNWVPTYEPEDKDMFDRLLDQFSNIEKSL